MRSPLLFALVLLTSACDGDPVEDAGPGADAGPASDAGGNTDAAGDMDAGDTLDVFAELALDGDATGTRRWEPPDNLVSCAPEPAFDGAFVRVAESGSGSPPGESAEHLDIDLFGPLATGDYTAVFDPTAAGPLTFDVFYHPDPRTVYSNGAASTPCTLNVSELAGGMLELAFDCDDLEQQFPPGAGRVSVSGRIRCVYP